MAPVMGTSVVVSKMQLAFGDLGLERTIDLINKIIAENKVPENWDTSVTVNLKAMELNVEAREGWSY